MLKPEAIIKEARELAENDISKMDYIMEGATTESIKKWFDDATDEDRSIIMYWLVENYGQLVRDHLL